LINLKKLINKMLFSERLISWRNCANVATQIAGGTLLCKVGYIVFCTGAMVGGMAHFGMIGFSDSGSVRIVIAAVVLVGSVCTVILRKVAFTCV
jgi:hypothetical protein